MNDNREIKKIIKVKGKKKWKYDTCTWYAYVITTNYWTIWACDLSVLEPLLGFHEWEGSARTGMWQWAND